MITASFKNSFVIDSQLLWASLVGVPQKDKLQYILLASSVPFWDTEPRFAKDNAVCVRAVGGLPIVLDNQCLSYVGGKGLPIEEALCAMTDAMGCAGMDSYLNLFDCTPSEFIANLPSNLAQLPFQEVLAEVLRAVLKEQVRPLMQRAHKEKRDDTLALSIRRYLVAQRALCARYPDAANHSACLPLLDEVIARRVDAPNALETIQAGGYY